MFGGLYKPISSQYSFLQKLSIPSAAHHYQVKGPFALNSDTKRRRAIPSTSTCNRTSHHGPFQPSPAIPQPAAGYNDFTATSLNSGHTWSDDEFQQWIYDQLVHEAGQVLYETYGDSMFVQLLHCITRRRQR
jgi:hypothetical protein